MGTTRICMMHPRIWEPWIWKTFKTGPMRYRFQSTFFLNSQISAIKIWRVPRGYVWWIPFGYHGLGKRTKQDPWDTDFKARFFWIHKFLPLEFDGCQEDMFDESHLGTMAWENVQNRTHEIEISRHSLFEQTKHPQTVRYFPMPISSSAHWSYISLLWAPGKAII